MLQGKEKEECVKILKLLDVLDLISLANTCCKKQVVVRTATEAIDVIVSFSSSMQELLGRKKISKQILLRYVTQSGQDPSRFISLNFMELVSSIVTQVQQPLVVSKPQNSFQDQAATVPPSQNVNYTVNFNVSFNANDRPSPMCGNVNDVNDEQQQGQEFVRTFYAILNSHHPLMGNPAESFSRAHFFENVDLYFLALTTSSRNEEHHHGIHAVIQKFLTFPRELNLQFVPNISAEGVRIQTDCFGRKIVLACGSLTKENSYIGVFQHSFGLVKVSDLTNAWKIMVTYLKLEENRAGLMPCLKDLGDAVAIENNTYESLKSKVNGS